MPPLPWIRLLALATFSFAGTLAANSLDPAVFGHIVLRLAPDHPNTLLGLTTFVGSLLAIGLAPIFGAFSDRTRSPLGPRLPFLLAGVPLLIVSLFGIALAPNPFFLVLAALLYRFADSLILPVWQALYPNFVPHEQRGLAAGLKSLMEILAVLIGRYSAGELLGLYPQLGEVALLAAVSLPALSLVLALGLTWGVVRRMPPMPTPEAPEERIWRTAWRSFKIDWRAHPAFTWWFINRALFWAGFITLGTFLLFFVIDVVGLPEAEAQRYLARLTLMLGGGILLLAVPSGRLADRLGRQPLIRAGCALAALGTGALLVVRQPDQLLLAGGLVGAGSSIYLSGSFALLSDIVPTHEAARFLGLATIAGSAGGALARLFGGVLVDPINAATGSNAAGYLTLYSLATLCFLLSWWSAGRLSKAAVPARV